MFAADTPPALSSPAPQSRRVIGIMATGPQADLDRLEASTKEIGLPCRQMDGPNGHELAVAFPPGSDPAKIGRYLSDLQSGKFSALKFRSAVAPNQ